jgi:hypothetical protein
VTVTMLRPGTNLLCPPSPMEIDWQVGRSTATRVRVAFEALAGDNRPGGIVRPLGAQCLLLTGLPETIALVARPATDEYFGDGVTFDVQLSLRGDDSAQGDQVVLQPHDVSGTASAVLLTIAPEPRGWNIVAAETGRSAATLPVGGPVEHRYPDAPTSADDPIAQRSAYSARRHAGRSAQPSELLNTYTVAVDHSASMMPHHQSGAVQSLLEVVYGINLVCGTDRVVPVWTTGEPPVRQRPDLSADTLSSYVDAVLSEHPFTSGTTFAPLVDDVATTAGRDAVLIISDDVPADLDAFTGALARPPGVARVSWHLLLIARSQDQLTQAEPWRNELRPLAALVDRGLVTASAVTPDDPPGWLAARLAVPDYLHAVVGGLGISSATAKPSQGVRR